MVQDPDNPGGPERRRRFTCRGVVQGVGFRPAVYRLATELGLSGFVRNDDRGATIEVQGDTASLVTFEERLRQALPPLARLLELRIEDLDPFAGVEFRVDATASGRRGEALTPPDAALCPACRHELDDPDDRRHRYPFITCTDCGPRYSVITALPYDRERTSMACFSLCPECEAEYGDPATRRFHAEPIACPRCGPRIWLSTPGGAELGESREALRRARNALAHGDIVAVKGLGGFQLACRADLREPVQRLRRGKERARKPFAVMVADLEVARSLVRLREVDEELLESARGPIVLAERRAGAAIDAQVAPGLGDLGVMLPTTPLHHELFRGADYSALVMTSGNRSDEPICVGNRDGLERLSGIADLFLLHDRDIVRRVDDSVVRAMPAGHTVVRRSRGFVPAAAPLPEPTPTPVLALGGYLQTTACVAVGGEAFPSQHVGDLDTDAARAFLLEVAQGLEGFLELEAGALVTDLHPDYPSTWLGDRLATERGARLLRFQHHLAHAAATLGEHGAFPAPGERAVGIILDGTGWGTDGTAWGCEWLIIDGALNWSRIARGSELPLIGGERAVREPWRVAVAALARHDLDHHLLTLPMARHVAAERLLATAELAASPTWPRANGAGRLFEAAGALLGLCVDNGFEGEAAVLLEALAASARAVDPWPEVALDGDVLPQAELLVAAARRLLAGEPATEVAAGLHRTFCTLAVELTTQVLPAGVRTVALGGGCLVNRLLARDLVAGLRDVGLEPLLPRELPTGDGGLSYGQAVLASVSLARGVSAQQDSPRRRPCASPSR